MTHPSLRWHYPASTVLCRYPTPCLSFSLLSSSDCFAILFFKRTDRGSRVTWKSLYRMPGSSTTRMLPESRYYRFR